MKKFITLILTLSMVLTFFNFSVSAAESISGNKSVDNANSWRYENGQLIVDHYSTALVADPYHPDATLTGIDVNRYQGEIDWEKVKAAGIDFAIIRCGYAEDKVEYDDPYFEYNASECERLGIPYGVYLYSYATSIQDASSEADHVLRLIEGHTLSFPVYYDLEDNTIQNSDHAAIATTFCNKIEAAGYPVGVYANLYWWNNYLTDSCFDSWYKWIAQWGNSCDYTGEYAMWQYSSTGTVDGINGNVDMNFLIGYPDDHGPVIDTSERDVYRIFGQTRYETSFTIADTLKETLGVEKFESVIVTSGTAFADALSGSYLSSVKNAPILITNDSYMSAVKEYISLNLAEGGTVYILGGEAAVPPQMETGLEKFNVKRLGGATRYETNLEILKEAGTYGKDIVICNGTAFADSLSASASKLPILLVNQTLTDAQKDFLGTTAENQKIIIGGINAVPQQLENEVKAYGITERIGGATRYETSVMVAQRFFDNPESVVLAYAFNFPDGLCGGPLAVSINSPLILTASDMETAAAQYAETEAIKNGYVLGGEGFISDKAVCKILRMPSKTEIPVK